jgi:hypothetical protein
MPIFGETDPVTRLPPDETMAALDERYLGASSGGTLPADAARLTGAAFTGPVTVPTPTTASSAATKAYVDSKVSTASAGAQTADLGYGTTFPTTRPDGSPLQDGDAYDFG